MAKSNPDPELISDVEWQQYQQLNGQISVNIVKRQEPLTTSDEDLSELARSIMPAQRKYALNKMLAKELSTTQEIISVIMALDTIQYLLAVRVLLAKIDQTMELMFMYNAPLQLAHLIKVDPTVHELQELLQKCLEYSECPDDIRSQVMTKLFRDQFIFDKLNWSFVLYCIPYAYGLMAEWRFDLSSHKAWKVLSYLALKDIFVVDTIPEFDSNCDEGFSSKLTYVYASYYAKRMSDAQVDTIIEQVGDISKAQEFINKIESLRSVIRSDSGGQGKKARVQ